MTTLREAYLAGAREWREAAGTDEAMEQAADDFADDLEPVAYRFRFAHDQFWRYADTMKDIPSTLLWMARDGDEGEVQALHAGEPVEIEP